MATLIQPLIDELGRRTRDDKFTATSREDVRTLLSQAQQFVAIVTQSVVRERVFNLEPQRAIYEIDAISNEWLSNRDNPGQEIAKLVGVRWEDLDLHFSPWESIAKSYGPNWLREFKRRPRGWGLIGKNLLLIHPAPLNESVPVTLTYVPVTLSWSGEGEDAFLELGSDYLPQLLDVAEGLIYLKRRKFEEALVSLSRAGLGVVDGKGRN